MYKDYKIFVVSPAHNEDKFVGNVIETMPDYVDHIIVIDDGSKDNTAEVVKNINSDRVTLLINEVNQGVGASVTRGIQKAIEMGADVSVTMAGDGQMDPKFLPDLLDALIDDKYDFAKGNRFFSRQSFQNMPRMRVFGNLALSFMTKLSSGYWHIIDTQNGYYALGPKPLHAINFERLTRGWPYENDLLVHLNLFNFRVKDVPIPAVYGEEISDIKPLKVIPTFAIFLFRRFIYRLTRKYVFEGLHPIALFFFSGFILFFWGIFFGIYVVISTLGPPIATTGSVMLSVLPLLMGFELLLQAMVLDIAQTPK